MLLKLIFVSLAIASVTAQVCIPGAEPDGDGGCRCSGGRRGDPQLCCFYDTDSRGCYVSGDPVLTSFTGNKIGLDFPCGTMIASSRRDNNNPLVNVFAAGKEVTSGTIVTSQVKIEFRQSSSVFSITFNFDQSPFIIKLHRNNQPAEEFTMADKETKYLFQAGILGDIVIQYNADLDIFWVSGGVMSINVRPSRGNNPQQANIPGVCIVEPIGSFSPNRDDTYACSLSTDILNTPSYLEKAIQPMKNYMFNNGILKDVTDPQYAGMCQAYQNTIVNNCDAADRFNAMKKCAFILFQPLVRRCFYEAGTGSRRVMNAFLDCLDTYCEGAKDLCDGLQSNQRFINCAPNLLDCQTWAPYRRVNSFVAGEGDGFNFGNADENQGPAPTEIDPSQFDILGSGGENQDNGGAGGVGGDGFIPDF